MKYIRPIAAGFSVIRRYRTRMTLYIAVVWTAVDLIFYLYHFVYHEPYNSPLFRERTATAVILRETNVFFLSMVMAYCLIFLLKDFFRNISLWLKIILKSVILIVVVLTMNFFIHFSYATLIDKQTAWLAVHSFYTKTFETHWLLEKAPEWIILFVLTQIWIEINEKYSPGVFFDIILGRYTQPKEERRIIMFLDMKDSTRIAEKLGHKDYYKFIRDFIVHISNGIMEYGGRIYQYVGDEIVISWPQSRRNALKAIYALIEARKQLNKNSQNFKQQYDISPEFKAAIHVGSVTIGEIGVLKRDLVMSGDTMNTAARMRTACNELNQKFIVSKEFLSLVRLKSYQAESLGPIDLKGKNSSVELYALKI